MRLQTVRWHNYGKDRLYVKDAEGVRVGWLDLLTGTRELNQRSLATAFESALVEFCATHGMTIPTQDRSSVEALSVPTPRVTETAMDPVARTESVPGWRDLALNLPGQEARAQAEVELAAMRDRSRIGTFLARTFDMKTDERAWRVGAGGEESIGARLDKLRKHGWHVLHAIPVGDRGSDIDHLIIGPGGVWTLNTKTHPGKSVWVGRHQVRVDGHKTDYLRNSRHEAERASRLLTEACGLPVFVKAALVFLTGTVIPDVTIKQLPEDVAILDRMDIPGAFRRSKGRLTEQQVDTIFEQARRSTTWQAPRYVEDSRRNASR